MDIYSWKHLTCSLETEIQFVFHKILNELLLYPESHNR
jgi:hypothetical protein